MSNAIALDASPEHIAYALLGFFIIAFALVSLFVKEKLFLSEAFVATAFGIIIGPYAIGVCDPLNWQDFDTVTLEFTRLVIAVQVMAVGVSLPRSYLVKEARSMFWMLIPLMVLMWLTSATLIWALIPNLFFDEAMILAACITPTDPVLSNSVVKGRFAEKHVPPRIRFLLSAESGVNDGMGLPFLFLGLYLIQEPSVGEAIGKWFYLVWAYQILFSVVIGGCIGAAARKLVKGAKNRNLIDKESFLVFSIALTLAVVGCVTIISSDDLLACFVCGNVFAWDDWFSNEIAEAHIQEVIDLLLNLSCFVYIGASLPFSSFQDAALELSVWRLVVLAICVLLFRRLPFVLALKRFIPALTTYREAAFAGWFGPIGVGAVFFTKVTAHMTAPEHIGPDAHNADRNARVAAVVYPVVMFMVLSSVLIHGITVPLLHLQYKYTRTWSRKREESNHAVTRLPHINIGDDIILRPPTINGDSNLEVNQRTIGTIGYDHQRSIGYDNQRSIGYDNQRSVGWDNQRSIGFDNQRSVNGLSVNFTGTGGQYTGFGIAGVPDLGRVSTNASNNNTRTLQDVVQEMKEAARGSKMKDTSTNSGSTTPNPVASPTSFTTPVVKVASQDTLTVNTASATPSAKGPNGSGGSTASSNNMGSSSSASGKQSPAPRSNSLQAMFHPHPHLADSNTPQPLGTPVEFSVGTPLSQQSRSSSVPTRPNSQGPPTSTTEQPSDSLRPPPRIYQRPSSVVKIHEVEREEEHGIVRTRSRDLIEHEDIRDEIISSPAARSSASTMEDGRGSLFENSFSMIPPGEEDSTHRTEDDEEYELGDQPRELGTLRRSNSVKSVKEKLSHLFHRRSSSKDNGGADD